MQLMQGDCLDLMEKIPTGGVNMILVDPPYGTMHSKWDKKIPLELLWEQYKRIISDNGAILIFSQQPYTSELILSNLQMFRYEIIWEKTSAGGFFNARKMPLRAHENITVFYKTLPVYNPVMHQKSGDVHGMGRTRYGKERDEKLYGKDKGHEWTETGKRYPTDVIKFSNWNGTLFGNNSKSVKHPTQKPVPLLEYLIKTYTNPGDIVLDNCMGSGSTGVACVNTGREFIGIEKDQGYFEIANERIDKALEKI